MTSLSDTPTPAPGPQYGNRYPFSHVTFLAITTPNTVPPIRNACCAGAMVRNITYPNAPLNAMEA